MQATLKKLQEVANLQRKKGVLIIHTLHTLARARLITLAKTLIIPDITKTEFNYCFIIHCFMENIQKLLCEMQVDFICASKNTRTNAPSGRITRNHSSARAL